MAINEIKQGHQWSLLGVIREGNSHPYFLNEIDLLEYPGLGGSKQKTGPRAFDWGKEA